MIILIFKENFIAKKKEIDPVFMLDFIYSIEDPSVDRTKKHALETIMIVTVCAVICGAKSWNEIEVYGKMKIEFLKKNLNLENGIPSHDTFRRFFMFLLPDCLQNFLNSIKDHWQVENQLHWHLDVTMREDDCRCRVEHSAVNFSSIRQLALGLVKKIVAMRSKTEKLSVRTKILKAGWDNDFLLEILLQ